MRCVLSNIRCYVQSNISYLYMAETSFFADHILHTSCSILNRHLISGNVLVLFVRACYVIVLVFLLFRVCFCLCLFDCNSVLHVIDGKFFSCVFYVCMLLTFICSLFSVVVLVVFGSIMLSLCWVIVMLALSYCVVCVSCVCFKYTYIYIYIYIYIHIYVYE